MLIAIVGPTAVGKSQLALKLAKEFEGEIISADSRQVYRFMDIGTAKPSLEDRAAIPHHLIDIVNPDEEFTLVRYQEEAYRAIQEVLQRGRVPFLVGGSGLYVKAVIEGWQIPRVAPNHELRARLEKQALEEGGESLYSQLASIDPAAAERIHSHNLRRVIRALEVYYLTGKPISYFQGKRLPPFQTELIGLTCSRDELYRRIDARVEGMIAEGLNEEVERLLALGYDEHLPSMSGLGYRQVIQYLRGETSLERAVEAIKKETHRFSRQQYTWFSLRDERVHWFDANGEVAEKVRDYLDSILSFASKHRRTNGFL